jgi:two-component system NtrC family sensor kinase
MDVTVSQYRLRYRSLTIKIFVAIVIVAVIPLLIMASVFRHYFTLSYKEEVQARLKALMGRSQARVESFIDDRLHALIILSRSIPPTDLKADKSLEKHLADLQENYGSSLVGLKLLDRQGHVVSCAGFCEDSATGTAAAPSLSRVLDVGSSVDAVTPQSGCAQYFTVAARVNHPEGPGVLVATIRMEALRSYLKDLEFGQSTRGFIAGNQGDVQCLFPEGARFPKEACPADLARDGGPGDDVIVTESESDSSVCVQARVKGADWRLVLVQDTRETYAALYAARRSSIMVLIFGSIGFICVAGAVSRFLSQHVARMDQETQLMNERLTRAGKLVSLGEMAAGIAHEINNPVGIMVQEASWIQDLLAEGQENLAKNMDEIRGAAVAIQEHGMRCKDIILKLLTLARPIPREPELVQLNNIVHGMVEIYSQRARLAKVEIQEEPIPELPIVKVSSIEVEQVLMNIINNCLDAMERSGGTIRIKTRIQGQYVVIDVSDTGPGIPPSELARVFDPFFTTKPVGKGTGLGLSICYGIMKNMHGDITVTSREGEGTTFHLYFPIHGKANPGTN